MRCLIIFLVIVLHGKLVASEVSVDMYADREQANIGEEINIDIIYAWPLDWEPSQIPDPSQSMHQENIFIVAAPPVETLKINGKHSHHWRFTILAQHSGAWALPRPGFQATGPQGQTQTASAPELILQIGIVEKPARLSEPSLMWTSADSTEHGINQQYWWVIIPLVIIIAGIVIYVLRRKPVEIQQSPYELFQASIDACKTCHQTKDTVALLSTGIRNYCGQTWWFDALGATNREMRRYLKPHIQSEALRQICNLLDKLEDIRWVPQEAQRSSIDPLIQEAASWCQVQEDARLAALEEDAA